MRHYYPYLGHFQLSLPPNTCIGMCIRAPHWYLSIGVVANIAAEHCIRFFEYIFRSYFFDNLSTILSYLSFYYLQLATSNNIRVLLKSVLIDLRARENLATARAICQALSDRQGKKSERGRYKNLNILRTKRTFDKIKIIIIIP